jgi:hypothetical protein
MFGQPFTDGNLRKVTISGFSATWPGTGAPNWRCVIDSTASRLLAWGTVQASGAFATPGTNFDFQAFDIYLPRT